MQHPIVRRALLVAAALLTTASHAQEADVALELTEVQSLALTQQPLLASQAAAARAAHASAIAAAQLPDPKLTAGLTDLPIDGPDRYSLRRDNFTMATVGVMQDFPRAEKRRLRGLRGEHEAELDEQMLTVSQLEVRRDAALAWLDVWRPERALELTRKSLREADLQAQATDIAYTSGRSTQADVLASRIALGLLRDDGSALEQEVSVARSKLSRWIGADHAGRVLCPELPKWPAPQALEQMLAALRTHPHLSAEAKRVLIAQDEVALARQSYKPDFGVELAYGYRPEFSDYVTVNFSMDLPLFTGNRQDRSLEAKLAEQEQAEQSSEGIYRQQEAELRMYWQGWQRAHERLRQFDSDVLPQSQQRVDVSLASWKAGQGTLAGVLDARRMLLDNQMKRLALVADAARYRLNLMYFAGDGL